MRLNRVVSGSQLAYEFQAGVSEQANIMVKKDDETHSIFRVGRDGQLWMQTYTVSGSGSATRPLPFATASGEVSVDLLSSGNYDTYSVTFPSGRFTKSPLVFVNTQGTVPRRTFGATGTSTSGFTLRTANYSGGNSGAQTVHWFAVQMEV